MKKIGKIEGAHSSQIEMVEMDGLKYVLKTSTLAEVAAEKFFYSHLKENNLPALRTLEGGEIKRNQILLEFVEGSPTLEGNQDPVFYKMWGELTRHIHEIHFDHSFYFDVAGNRQELNWSKFLERDVKSIENKGGLSKEVFSEAIKILSSPPKNQFSNSLLHCDLHQNNVLVKDGELYFFDIGADMSSGDPLYDLAIVMINLPNGLYIDTSEPEYMNDQALRDAFIEGYGNNFVENDRKALDWYVLLRAIQRYPNKFEPYLQKVISTVLRDYQR